MTVAELRAAAAQKRAAAKAMLESAEKETRDLTAEESAGFDATIKEAESLANRADRLHRLGEIEEAAAQPREVLSGVNIPPTAGDDSLPTPKIIRNWAEPKRASIRNFRGPDAEERAHRFGQFLLASWGPVVGAPIERSRKALRWCKEHGVQLLATQREDDNSAGGIFVPDEFDSDMIILREQYGVGRRRLRRSPMTSDTKSRTRLTGGATAYFVGFGQAATKSTVRWDAVQLVAKELAVIMVIENNLQEDSPTDIGERLAPEVAQAFAFKEDDCIFNGDGTSTYGGINGFRNKLKGLSATIADIAGLVVATGNLFSEVTNADFIAMIAKLPVYADTSNVAWFIHKAAYAQTMLRLQMAAGGNTAGDIARGIPPQHLAYPVEFVQSMPKVDANSQVFCLLGDLSLAADLGDRRGNTVSFATEGTVSGVNLFETRQSAMMGTERFDVNVHDVGNAAAAAADQVPGPVIGLISAAS